jgi:uncharacterized protein YjbI with pentapeptide repeats
MMEIRVTGKSGGKVAVQDVRGELRDMRFQQTGTWINFNARCERVDFSGMRADPFNAFDSEFIDCSFERVRFRRHELGSSLHQPVFRNCRFDWCDLRGLGSYENVRFEGCTFRNAKILHWQADEAEFVDCVFSGLMRDVRFSGRPWPVQRYGEANRQIHEEMATKYGLKTPYVELERKRNEFRGNDFREAQFDYVSFVYGIDVDAQTMPSGPQYMRLDRPKERIESARSIVARWPDEKLREHSLFELRLLGGDGYDEQAVIFTDRLSAPSAEWRELSQPVYDLLEHVLD